MCWAVLVLAFTTAGWRDEFDSAQPNERWQWQCPAPGPTLAPAPEPGWFRVTVPQREVGYNHWLPGEHAQDAPMLTTPAPPGDFAFEAHLRLASFGPASNFHAALVVGFSPGYVLGWGPFRAPLLGRPADEPELWCEPTGLGRFLAVPGPARDLFLRIEKRGQVYGLSYRRPGEEDWTAAGDYRAFAAPTFLGFMGKTFGAGEAVVFEVDYAVLDEAAGQPAQVGAAQQPATLTVVADGPRWELDDRRYAHFIEHMHRCIHVGFWAEKLNNRKFTGAADAKGVVEGWRRVGEVRFAPDNSEWYVPCQSQRLELAGAEAGGLAQGPIGFRAKVNHVGYLVAKSRPEGMRLDITLVAEDRTLAAAQVGPLSEEWGKYSFALPALPEVTQAEVRITAAGSGTVWLGAASLMPADNVDGWRADVLEVVRGVRPPAIRWPGGNFASQYDWRDGLGDRDRRPPRWNRAWNHWEWNDVGTDEFLRLCALLETEPYICANAGEGSARQAAEWVEYCNGPADSPMGVLRAANGHPEAYGVTLWGLGNEMYGNWQHGHLAAVPYAIKAVEMAEAMRAVDAGLKLVLVGVEGGGWGEWNRQAVGVAGRHCDYLSVHHYTGLNADADAVAEYARALAAAVRVEGMLGETWEIARQANGGLAVPLCFDEWNIARRERDDLPGHRGFYCLREGLFAAGIFNALNRLGPKVPIACVTQTVNVLGLIRVNETSIAPSPSYWALRIFREAGGAVGLPVEYSGPEVDLAEVGRTAALDVSATLDPAAGRVAVFMVNRDAASARAVDVRVRGARLGGPVRAVALTADGFLAANDYADPRAVEPRDWPVGTGEEGTVSLTVPPHSLVAVSAGLEGA